MKENWDLTVDTKFTKLFKADYPQTLFYLLYTYYFGVIFTYHLKKRKRKENCELPCCGMWKIWDNRDFFFSRYAKLINEIFHNDLL